MNAKDIENIKWTLENGQHHERIQLLSLISQILDLTSNAVSNGNGSSSRRHEKTTDESEGRAAHQNNKKSNENSLSNIRSLQYKKTTDDGQRGVSLQHMPQHGRTSSTLEGGEMSHKHQHNRTYSDDVDEHDRTSPTLEGGEVSHEHQPNQSVDVDKLAQTPTAIGSELGGKQTSSNKNKISGNSQGSSRNNGNSFDLNTLILSDVCAEINDYYEENRCLDKLMQKSLMKIMCNELLKGPKVSNETINQISTDVCLIFVTEDKKSYYDKQSGSAPTGKFYDMYRNAVKTPVPSKKSRKRKAEVLSNVDADGLDLDEFSDEIKESVNYFKTFDDDNDDDVDKNNSEIIMNHWSASYCYRRSALRKKTYDNITYILNDWPIIKRTYGFDLINFDFEKQHGPLCGKSLVTNWKYIVRVTDMIHEMINRKKIKSLIARLPSKDTEYDNIVLAKSLHYLVTQRPTTTTNGFKLTPTMEDSQKSFYQFATGLNNLEKKISEMEDYWRFRTIDPHPIIFGVNSDSTIQYVVVLRQLRFHFNDFVNAMDAAFKIFHFFNIPYPPESKIFWSILNAMFYKLSGDKVTGTMNSTIHTLNVHITNAQKASPSRKRSKISPAKSVSSSTSSSP